MVNVSKVRDLEFITQLFDDLLHSWSITAYELDVVHVDCYCQSRADIALNEDIVVCCEWLKSNFDKEVCEPFRPFVCRLFEAIKSLFDFVYKVFFPFLY